MDMHVIGGINKETPNLTTLTHWPTPKLTHDLGMTYTYTSNVTYSSTHTSLLLHIIMLHVYILIHLYLPHIHSLTPLLPLSISHFGKL